jgi:hypothetical protein
MRGCSILGAAICTAPTLRTLLFSASRPHQQGPAYNCTMHVG